jgi:UDP-glucose 4-epimerase
MRLNGKRVLVTGASGFVGKHLAAELRKQEAEVFALDSRGPDPIDIRNWHAVKGFGSKLGRLDLVYHLAALMFVPYSFENPRETYEVNVLGTLNVLELCRLQGFPKLVFASSYVYGEPRYLPVDEEHPLNPGSPYARSKVLGEDLCKAYHEDHGLRCTILRVFNIYGEGQTDSFLIPSMIKQLASGKVELMDPEPKRDFVHVSDVVQAYLRAGEYDQAGFNVFNIGSGVSYSVDDIVKLALQAWGQEARVRYRHQRRKSEVMDVVADFRKARTELGWEPKVTLEQGIRHYVEWYRKNVG